MEYTATAKYIRTSPRKVRLVARSVKGKSVDAAIASLMTLPKPTAKPLLTLIESAKANVLQKHAGASLVVASIDVAGGPVLKRWHAASRGMAHSYKKRMSHVKITLKEEDKKS